MQYLALIVNVMTLCFCLFSFIGFYGLVSREDEVREPMPLPYHRVLECIFSFASQFQGFVARATCITNFITSLQLADWVRL